ncbi:MAG: DUF3768 domain-containing protein [Gammaproteobacteria bacterium]|nr:DUF3768 domain-containing protein [Gammaproteobacteria bacterium]
MQNTATDNRSETIAFLNDSFRKSPTQQLGRLMMTYGVSEMDVLDRLKVMALVKDFSDFTPDNDPYGEHDFGSFEYKGDKFFWKIDYYDANYEYGSPDPANTEVTRRVLTVMFASEY